MKRTITALTAALIAGAAFAANAGDPGRHGKGNPQEKIKAADTNGDGMISRDEAKALPRLAQHFDQIDADKNGFVTTQELQAMHGKHREERFARMDTDRDGKISKAEADRFPKLGEKFTALDTNGDGFLSKDELSAAHGPRKART